MTQVSLVLVALSKVVTSGGRAEQIMLTEGVGINRPVQGLLVGVHPFSGPWEEGREGRQ